MKTIDQRVVERFLKETEHHDRPFIEVLEQLIGEEKEKMKTEQSRKDFWSYLAKRWEEIKNEEAEQEQKQDELKIVIVEPNKRPEQVTIKNDSETMREIVGGWLETVIFDKPYLIVCNEEGQRLELPLNRHLGHMPLLGTFFITKVNTETGEFVDLDQDEADVFQTAFSAQYIMMGPNY